MPSMLSSLGTVLGEQLSPIACFASVLESTHLEKDLWNSVFKFSSQACWHNNHHHPSTCGGEGRGIRFQDHSHLYRKFCGQPGLLITLFKSQL